MQSLTFSNIDEYIALWPVDVQRMLVEVRDTIKEIVPDAEEAIKYGIPTFVLNGKNLVHFSAFKNHIGFYPAPTAMEAFAKDLSGYKTGKGSVQFPIDKAMPLKLIAKIVKWRLKEIAMKTK